MKPTVPFASLLLTAVPLAAATGCNRKPETQRCLDAADHVVPYSECQLPVRSVRVPGSLNTLTSHHFYYGGYGGDEVGSTAWGGSDRPLAGHVYQPDTVGNPVPASVLNSPQPYVVSVSH